MNFWNVDMKFVFRQHKSAMVSSVGGPDRAYFLVIDRIHSFEELLSNYAVLQLGVR